MTDYLFHHNANTHWRYPSSVETDAAIARRRGRRWRTSSEASPDEIVFGQNMTTLTYPPLARARARAGGPATRSSSRSSTTTPTWTPWKALARERGVTIRTVAMRPETGHARRRRPRARDHAAHEARRDRRGVQRAGHDQRRARGRRARPRAPGPCASSTRCTPRRTSSSTSQRSDCDYLACSPYKFYGPHLGVLWGRRQLLDGARRAEAAPGARLVAGTGRDRDAVARGDRGRGGGRGFPGGSRGRGARAIAPRGARVGLRRPALARPAALRADVGGARRDRRRAPLRPASVRPAHSDGLLHRSPGTTADAVAEALARRGVFASSGDFYAWTVVERLGHTKDGVVRAGCACYTTADEVDRLIEGVIEIAGGRARDNPTVKAVRADEERGRRGRRAPGARRSVPGEALMRTRVSGICGSDLLDWYVAKKAGTILGHEVSGEIVSGRSRRRGVSRPATASLPIITRPAWPAPRARPDGTCTVRRGRRRAWSPGAWRSWSGSRPVNLAQDTRKIPDGVTDEEASFVEPLATVVKAFRRGRFSRRAVGALRRPRADGPARRSASRAPSALRGSPEPTASPRGWRPRGRAARRGRGRVSRGDRRRRPAALAGGGLRFRVRRPGQARGRARGLRGHGRRRHAPALHDGAARRGLGRGPARSLLSRGHGRSVLLLRPGRHARGPGVDRHAAGSRSPISSRTASRSRDAGGGVRSGAGARGRDEGGPRSEDPPRSAARRARTRAHRARRPRR